MSDRFWWQIDPRRLQLTFLGYSVIDFSLIDPHFGNLQSWIDLIEEMHRRNMYLIADFTVGTMGDMIGVKQCVQFKASCPCASV